MKVDILTRIAKVICYKNKITARSVVRCLSDCDLEEKETHTGQKWSEDDYRLARFVDRPKHVNPNFSMKFAHKIPPKVCEERIVWCDGGGLMGHPKVFINLDKPGMHYCMYCGAKFYKEDHH